MLIYTAGQKFELTHASIAWNGTKVSTKQPELKKKKKSLVTQN